jgi:hypothetical protein
MKDEKSSDRTVFVLGACLAFGALLAALAFLFLDLTVWTAVLAALLFVCPVIIGWGLFQTARRGRSS